MKPVLEISDVLSSLAKQRLVFHSEADFQHAFAWEIHARSQPVAASGWVG
jgi:hypothetical protein